MRIEIVFYAKGKIHRINIHTLNVQNIPFTVDVKQRIEDAVLFKQEVAPKEFEAKMVRNATTSPDGKWLAFNAAGHVYVKLLPDGEPVRATSDDLLEFMPAFSPDSRSLIFVTWDDVHMGGIRKISLDNIGGNSFKLTNKKGIYTEPSFDPSGKRILFRKNGGNSVVGQTHTTNPGIYIMPASGGGNGTRIHIR